MALLVNLILRISVPYKEHQLLTNLNILFVRTISTSITFVCNASLLSCFEHLKLPFPIHVVF